MSLKQNDTYYESEREKETQLAILNGIKTYVMNSNRAYKEQGFIPTIDLLLEDIEISIDNIKRKEVVPSAEEMIDEDDDS